MTSAITRQAWSGLPASAAASWRWYRRKARRLFERAIPPLERLNERRTLVSAYSAVHGRPPRLHPPRTLNEKIVAASLGDHHPLLTLTSDKMAVLDYVARRIGGDHLLPLLGMWKHARDIAWERLPPAFVLKPSHASGLILKVENLSGLDREAAAREADRWLGIDFYRDVFREWRYRDIPRRILAQPLLPGQDGASPQDHSLFCFAGEPRFLKVVGGRHGSGPLRIAFYDMDSRELLGVTHNRRIVDPSLLPDGYDWNTVARLARALAADFDFVRVDFLWSGGRLWFGELTFTDNAGRGLFDPPEWDERLGALWPLRDGIARFVRPGVPAPVSSPSRPA